MPRLEIPVNFFSCKYDLTLNIDLSKAYFAKIEAPVKGFYTFQNSAHGPLFEEPQRVKSVMITDVLNPTALQADMNK